MRRMELGCHRVEGGRGWPEPVSTMLYSFSSLRLRDSARRIRLFCLFVLPRVDWHQRTSESLVDTQNHARRKWRKGKTSHQRNNTRRVPILVCLLLCPLLVFRCYLACVCAPLTRLDSAAHPLGRGTAKPDPKPGPTHSQQQTNNKQQTTQIPSGHGCFVQPAGS